MIIPAEKKNENSKKILQKLSESAVIGDIVSPIDEDWDAEKW